jgi:enoyl-CoA hydratase
MCKLDALGAKTREDFMSIPNLQNFIVEVDDSIATVVINREAKLNALNSEVLREFKLIFTDILPSLNLTGVILTGSGEKAFIAGADIKEMSQMTVHEAKEFGSLGQSVTFSIEHFKTPVIAVVNGFALGGGCEMSMSCDFIYATDSAVFGQPEVKLGLIPGFGGTQRLAKYIGRNRAKEIIYTGENIKAAEALRLGLCNKVFASKAEALKAAKETLVKIAANSPLAVSTSKKVMNEGNDLGLKEGLQKELDQFGNLFASHDLKEGTAAFVEKRKANFLGK